MFNAIYVIYPAILLSSLASTIENLHENWIIGLSASIIPGLIEIFQILNDPKGYLGSITNILDFFGIFSVIIYFILGDRFALTPLLILGLFFVFYRGILSISIISQKFMINLKLVINSMIDLVPFLIVLLGQVMLFGALDFVK